MEPLHTFPIVPVVIGAIGAFILLLILLKSFNSIGENEIGLVIKRLGKKLQGENPIAFNNEAGYQAELLMPGLRFKFWPIYSVQKHPWVQVPAGQIGVVIAQVGQPLPIGAKSAVYKKGFGDFRDLQFFIQNGGQKGIQRPVLSPGTVLPMHPVAFMVVTATQTFGVPISDEIRRGSEKGRLGPQTFGLGQGAFMLQIIAPPEATNKGRDDKSHDIIGIVRTLEGNPVEQGDIASRLGGFNDILQLEMSKASDAALVEAVFASRNNLHNNYQDYQAFMDNGGLIGLQHDPLLYGAYALNPFLVRVEIVPMTVVEQGEVAVVKAYVGLPTQDTSGAEFKFGSLVYPGHRGIWREPLRTGKYPLNPRCYQVEIVPTSILTLNWADATSKAHDLDQQLKQIEAKSNEGFVFRIDLQVQIHVPDTMAPKIISMVGTMQNLVNEVLQAAVGNHFRDKLQSMPAIKFIETRQQVQKEAEDHVTSHLRQYEVETRGVYIQDVVLPQELVTVLKEREIANQQIATYMKQKEAQDQRVQTEASKATADKQVELVGSRIDVDVKENRAQAREKEARGEAAYIRETGTAKGAEVQAIGLAYAKGFEEQVKAIGADGTALVNAIRALAEKGIAIVPQVQVTGGGNGSAMEGLMAVLMQRYGRFDKPIIPTPSVAKTDLPAKFAPVPTVPTV